MARYPGRPSAKQLPDVVVLEACRVFTDKGEPHPVDAFDVPGKVTIAKLRKIEARGWIDKASKITKTGRAALAEADW